MFDFGTDWWEIIIRTVVVYGALIAGFRLTGKRQIGQMSPFDLVVILLIANAVQNAMVGPDNSLGGGLISAGALLVVNQVVVRYRDRLPGMQRLVEGHGPHRGWQAGNGPPSPREHRHGRPAAGVP